jgi:hypothetical protein
LFCPCSVLGGGTHSTPGFDGACDLGIRIFKRCSYSKVQNGGPVIMSCKSSLSQLDLSGLQSATASDMPPPDNPQYDPHQPGRPGIRFQRLLNHGDL